nr:excalibur calcium-binding domain-containing protein [Sphingomonas sp. Y57]
MRLGIAVAVATFMATIAQAHGGGLNAEGCHNDRKTGDYHCHRGPSAGASRAPLRSYQLLDAGTATRPYANCTAARAAGAAPVYAGTPGYGRHLDRDGDGIGCE